MLQKQSIQKTYKGGVHTEQKSKRIIKDSVSFTEISTTSSYIVEKESL